MILQIFGTEAVARQKSTNVFSLMWGSLLGSVLGEIIWNCGLLIEVSA